MAIVASQIVEDIIQGAVRRVKYQYTDSAGGVHVVGPVKVPLSHDAGADLAARIPGIEAELANNELEQMARHFYRGENPLRDASGSPVDPVHQSRTAAIQALLRDFLSSADPVKIMRATRFLGNLSDAELRALLGITQVEVDAIRAKAANLANVAAQLDAYTPELSNV